MSEKNISQEATGTFLHRQPSVPAKNINRQERKVLNGAGNIASDQIKKKKQPEGFF